MDAFHGPRLHLEGETIDDGGDTFEDEDDVTSLFEEMNRMVLQPLNSEEKWFTTLLRIHERWEEWDKHAERQDTFPGTLTMKLLNLVDLVEDCPEHTQCLVTTPNGRMLGVVDSSADNNSVSYSFSRMDCPAYLVLNVFRTEKALGSILSKPDATRRTSRPNLSGKPRSLSSRLSERRSTRLGSSLANARCVCSRA